MDFCAGESEPLFHLAKRSAHFLSGNQLWEADLFFGEIAPISRQIVLQAMKQHPAHCHKLKLWWAGYQKIKKRNAIERREEQKAAEPPATNKAVAAVIEDALKFDAYWNSQVRTLAFCHGGQIFAFSKPLPDDQATPHPYSLVHSSHYVYDKGLRNVHVATALIYAGKLVALGPYSRGKSLVLVDQSDPPLKVTKVHSTPGADHFSILPLLSDNAPHRGIETEAGRNSILFKRFQEAAEFVAKDSRNMFKILIVLSDTGATYAVDDPDQEFPIPTVSLGQLRDDILSLTETAKLNLEKRLRAECYKALGVPEKQAETGSSERAETLFKLIRERYFVNYQLEWMDLQRFGIDTRYALEEVAKHRRVKVSMPHHR